MHDILFHPTDLIAVKVDYSLNYQNLDEKYFKHQQKSQFLHV